DGIGYRYAAATGGGIKGESIAGSQTDYDGLNGRYGRGAPANGGGGGNSYKAGGGGGANGNAGGTWSGNGVMDLAAIGGAVAWPLDPNYASRTGPGGGRGGYSSSEQNLNATVTAPGNAGWGLNLRRERGGLGGRVVANDPANRLFMGGGGGGGSGDTGAAGAGGNGGGIILLIADRVQGSGALVANGHSGGNSLSASNDGGGGGGAGGTIIVRANIASGFSVSANGGDGGWQLSTRDEAEGPGGGGGGGYIATSGGAVTRSVAGGRNGVTTSTGLTEFPANGATLGAAGQAINIPVPTGASALNILPLKLECTNLTITKTDGAGVTTEVPGTPVTYTIVVTNNGPNPATNALVTDAFPAILSNINWSCTAAGGGNCASPTGTGNIDALVTLPVGATATFVATADIAANATGNLVNSAAVRAPATISDLSPADASNLATDTDVLAPSADLSLTASASAEPVDEAATYSYTLVVNNGGPSTAATTMRVTFTVPAGTTYVSASGSGWSCSQAAGVVTCNRNNVAPGAVPNIVITVTAPPEGGVSVTASGTIFTTGGPATPDPVAANNSVSVVTNVTAVNDPPVNFVPGAQTVGEDVPLLFAIAYGNLIQTSDVDAPSPAQVEVTLSAPAGTLSLSQLTGLTFSVGDGTGDATMTFRGTLPLINAALNGLGFQPNPNFAGATTLVITTNDLGNTGTGGPKSDTDTVSISVTGANDPPTALDDAITVAEDSGVTSILVLANDTIAPDTGETLTVIGVTPASHGLVSGTGTAVSYTPNANYYGSDQFTYTISDGNGGEATATVRVTVTSVNDPPTANADTFFIDESAPATAVPVLVNDSYLPDIGETLTIVSVTQPAHGTVVITGGGTGLTYQPTANYNGADQFSYTIGDSGGSLTATALVDVTVGPVNDPPVHVLPGAQSIDGDTQLVFSSAGGNAVQVSDPDAAGLDVQVTLSVTHGLLTLASTSGLTFTAGDGTSDQAVSFTGTIVGCNAALNGLLYVPQLYWSGEERLTITTNDLGHSGNGGARSTTNEVVITVRPVNHDPVANADTFTVLEDSTANSFNVLANDDDGPDSGETLTVLSVTQPVHGTVEIVLPGSTHVTYTPTANYNGTDQFSYTITDPGGRTALATVHVTVGPVNDPPVHVLPGAQAIDGDTSLTLSNAAGRAIQVTDLDAAASNVHITLTVTHGVLTLATSSGLASVSGDGSANVVLVGSIDASNVALDGLIYAPTTYWSGTETLTITTNDLGNSGSGGARSTTNEVVITVRPVNHDPVANADSFNVPEDSPATPLNVLLNDSTVPDSDETLTVDSVTQPAHGMAAVAPGGTGVTYQPTPLYDGPDSFTYTISDGRGGHATATVSITVTPVNHPPTAVDDSATLPGESPATFIDVLANDSILPDSGETLTVVAVSAPGSGSSAIAPGGSGVTYQPAAQFSGADSFTYTISDGHGGLATATVSVTVTSVDHAPVANDDVLFVEEGSGDNLADVLANDSTAPDLGETLTIVAVSVPAHGIATITSNGSSISYRPTPGYAGTDQFTYTIADSDPANPATDTATVDVTVGPVNHPPVISLPSPQTTDEEVPLVFSSSGANAISVADVDANGGDEKVTLSVTKGTLTVASTAGLAFSQGDGANDVTMSFTGSLTAINAALDGLLYQPGQYFHGQETLSVNANDLGHSGNGGAKEGNGEVLVTVRSVNQNPTAVDDTATVLELSPSELDVLANDSSFPDEGETLSVLAVTQPQHGTAEIIQDGAKVLYTSGLYFGDDSFTYTVSDGNGGLATATVTLHVNPTPQPPTVEDFEVIVPKDSIDNPIDVLAHSSYLPNPPSKLLVAFVSQPAHGTATITEDGQMVLYTPAAGFGGLDGFTYVVQVENGRVASAAVSIIVGQDTDKDGLTDLEEELHHTDPNNPDTDADGVFDGPEVKQHLTNPLDDDSDDDGLKDGAEVTDLHTDPLKADTDGDGLTDGLELGLTVPQGVNTDPSKFAADLDPSDATDPLKADSDADGLLDGEEDKNHNGREDRSETDPRVTDTDEDGLNDGVELKGANPTNPLRADCDDDGLMDGTEDKNQNGQVDPSESDPNVYDTDQAGVPDGDEVERQTDPTDPADDYLVAGGGGCGATGVADSGSGLALLGLGGLALASVLRRRRGVSKAGGSMALAFAVAAGLLLAPASTRAQSAPVASAAIDAQQFKGTPGATDILGVASGGVGNHLEVDATLFLNYASSPLVLRDPKTGETVSKLVDSQLTAELLASLALFKRVEIGLALPLVYQSGSGGGDLSPLVSGNGGDPGGIGMGDLRLVPKFAILLGPDEEALAKGEKSRRGVPVKLAVSVAVVFPTGGSTSYRGGGWGAQPRLSLEGKILGARLLGSVGANFHRTETLLNLKFSHELAYGVAAEYPIALKGADLTPELALVGAVGFSNPSSETAPLELRGALKVGLSRAVWLSFGAGGGLTRGYGTPSWRALVGLGFAWLNEPGSKIAAPPPPMPVAPDRRPAKIDHVSDKACPGCVDGVPPVPANQDADKDGVADAKDRCAAAAEDLNGYEDDDGCPDADADSDGVVDAQDKCPNEPETINGFTDDDGCADAGPVLVSVKNGMLSIAQKKIEFSPSRSNVSQSAEWLIKQVALTMKARRDIAKVVIEAHTDTPEAPTGGDALSLKRAGAIRDLLVAHGVHPSRLELVGWGNTRPLDIDFSGPVRSSARIELRIVQMRAKPAAGPGKVEAKPATVPAAAGSSAAPQAK
ncbi:MAG: tandem-95 repeat protein, partial [Deltaproteobacteria bacterium]|nr:tandem-95 repeat protein [Deltaproteobacteria bacterium]